MKREVNLIALWTGAYALMALWSIRVYAAPPPPNAIGLRTERGVIIEIEPGPAQGYRVYAVTPSGTHAPIDLGSQTRYEMEAPQDLTGVEVTAYDPDGESPRVNVPLSVPQAPREPQPLCVLEGTSSGTRPLYAAVENPDGTLKRGAKIGDIAVGPTTIPLNSGVERVECACETAFTYGTGKYSVAMTGEGGYATGCKGHGLR